jgi:hypothetical protein
MDQIGLVRKEVSIAAVKYGQRGEITVNGIKKPCYGSHRSRSCRCDELCNEFGATSKQKLLQ